MHTIASALLCSFQMYMEWSKVNKDEAGVLDTKLYNLLDDELLCFIFVGV